MLTKLILAASLLIFGTLAVFGGRQIYQNPIASLETPLNVGEETWEENLDLVQMLQQEVDKIKPACYIIIFIEPIWEQITTTPSGALEMTWSIRYQKKDHSVILDLQPLIYAQKKNQDEYLREAIRKLALKITDKQGEKEWN